MAYSVSGDGSTNGGTRLVAGSTANGTLTITSGAYLVSEVTAGAAAPGYAPTTGTVTLDGPATTVDVNPGSGYVAIVHAGVNNPGGNGYLNVTNGAVVTTTRTVDANAVGNGFNLVVGFGTNTTGAVTVDGTGSTFTAGGTAGLIQIGEYGTGTLAVSNGGLVETLDLSVGTTGGIGEVQITGGSTVNASDSLSNPEANDLFGPFLVFGQGMGKGTLTIESGSTLNVDNAGGVATGLSLTFGEQFGSTGYGTITGTGSALNLTNATGNIDGAVLRIGRGGQGDVTVSDNAQINVIGNNPLFFVSEANNGQGQYSRLQILSGADVLVDSQGYGGQDPGTERNLGSQFLVGLGSGSSGGVVVDGAGSTLTVTSQSEIAGDYVTGQISVGQQGVGALQVSNGGAVVSREFQIAAGGGTGTVNVTTGGTITVTGTNETAYQGVRIGNGGRGYLTIDGVGSSVTSRGDANPIGSDDGFPDGITESSGRFRIGAYSYGKVDITNGGSANGFFVELGRGPGGQGYLTIDGYGSSFNASNEFGTFYTGSGSLTGGFVRLGSYGGSYGRAEITNGGAVNVINEPGTVADEPGIDLGRRVGATGVLLVDGDDGSGNSSILNVRQYGRGNDGGNPGTVLGPFLQLGRYGGEGIVTIRNSAVGQVIGESASITIGRGADYGLARISDQSVLTVESGGTFTVDGRGPGYEVRGDIFVGLKEGGNGRFIVSGTGSTVNIYSDNADNVSDSGGIEFGASLQVGVDGRGELLVEGGGQITIDGADDAFPNFVVGSGGESGLQRASGYATITGAGSSLILNGTSTANFGEGAAIRVGLYSNSHGELTIADGGVLSNGSINSVTRIGANSDTDGTGIITVTGLGSTLNAGTVLSVGSRLDFDTGVSEPDEGGEARLVLEQGGLVTAGSAIVGDAGTLDLAATLQSNTGVTGTLNVGGDTATGTGDITGNFTQNSGLLDFEIVDAANLDLLRITGDATLAAAVFMIDLSGLGPVLAGDRFDILEVDGQLTLDVSQLDLSNTGAPSGVTVSVERNGTPDGVGGFTDNVVTVVVDTAPLNAVSVVGLDQTVAEGDPGDDARFLITLERSGDLTAALTVDFSLTGTGSNAVDAADFQGGVLPSGTATFLASEATTTIELLVAEDNVIEEDETFSLTISNPATGGTVPVVSNNEVLGTILNDDLQGVGGLQLSGDAELLGSGYLRVADDADGDATFDGGRHVFSAMRVSQNDGSELNISATGTATLAGRATVLVQSQNRGDSSYVAVGVSRAAGYNSIGYLTISDGSFFEARNTTNNNGSGGLNGGYSNINIGRNVGGTGTVVVTGEDSVLLATGGGSRIGVGRDGGDGTLRVEDGGYVGTFNITAGRGNTATTGSVVVDGQGSTIRISPEFGFYGSSYVGSSGYSTFGRDSAGRGYVTVQNGGRVIVDNNNGETDVAYFRLARDLGGFGYAKITGEGSSLTLDQVGSDTSPFDTGAMLLIGDGGQGRMIVEDNATVDVLGEGARITIADGRDDTGALEQSLLAVRSGAVVTVDPRGFTGHDFAPGSTVGGSVDVAAGTGTNGRLEISGTGSRVVVQNDLDDTTEAMNNQFAPFVIIAGRGNGELLVENGGRLIIDGADDSQPGFSIAQGSSSEVTAAVGSATVTGTGSFIDVIGTGSGNRDTPIFNDGGFIAVGRNDGTTGTLLIEQGGRVNNPTLDSVTMIGPRSGGTGTVTVTDAGSVLNAGALLAVGGDFAASTGVTDLLNGGTGTLNIFDGGVVNAGEALFGTNGTLNIDGGFLNVGDLEINGGALNPGGPGGIGLATVNGNADLSLGTLNFEILSVSEFGADRVVIDGDASIEEATLNFDFSGLGSVAVGNAVTILEVTGQLTDLDVSLIDLTTFSPPPGVTFDLVQTSDPDGSNNLISLEVLVAGSGTVGVIGFEQFVDEGDPGGDQRFVYTLERSGDLNSMLTVDFAVTGRGANPVDGVDFDGGVLPAGTATFLATEATTTVELLVSEDMDIEADEGLLLTISNPVDGGGGTINVVNPDAPGTIRNDDLPDTISINPFSETTEVDAGGSSFITFTVTRTGDLVGDLTVDYVIDASGDASNVDLLANGDDLTSGTPQNGQVTILDGQATATFQLEVEGDDIIEPREDFDVTLTGSSDPLNYIFGIQTSVGRINNDDGRPPVIPIGLEADVFGDPHLVTLDGLGYDFQAVGEFTLVENTAGADLDVQIRTAPVPGSDLVSIISAMATDMGNGDTIMIDAFGDPALLVNRVPTEVPTSGADPIAVGNGEIFYDGETYTIVFGSGEALTVKQFDGFLNVCVFLDPIRGPGEVRGLLGNADGNLSNDYALRDGSAPPAGEITFDGMGTPSLDFDYLYTTYADSWRITDGISLFEYTGAPGDQGTADYTDTSFPVGVLSVDILPDDLLAEAEAAADAAGIIDPVLREAAILDFALTGDDQFAEGASGVAADPEVNTAPNEAPVLPTTVGVTAADSQVTEGDSGAKTVTFTFYRIGDLTDALQVGYTVGGTADASDLSGVPALSADVTFGSGQSTVSLSFDIAGDVMAESDETLVVNLIAPDGVLVGAPSAITTIQNDDNLPVTQDDAAATDEDTPLQVVVADLLLNDVDPDGDALTVIAIDSASSGGAAVAETAGTITYDPTQAFNSLATGESAVDTFTYTVSDGNGGTDTANVSVTVAGITDESISDDTATVAEDETVNIDIDANDNALPGRILGTVAGQSVMAGDVVTLASGAEVTVNIDGTVDYDPNGRFNSLVSVASAAATGATNTGAVDTFTYTFGGLVDQATVEVTITGVDGAGDQLAGDAGNNTLTGSNAIDFLLLGDGGFDDARGGGGNDAIFFGASFDRNDKVDGGSGTFDQIGLQGDYSDGVVFGPEGTVGVEAIILLPGNNTAFGASGTEFFSYNLTLIDANILAGQQLAFQANQLRSTEGFKLDASAETDGSIFTFAGLGAEDLKGTQQSDSFFFGTGRFTSVDKVDGQAGALDSIGLQGDYSGGLFLGPDQIKNIAILALLTNTDARFGAASATPFSYDLTLDDGNVAAGEVLTISGNSLSEDEFMFIDGSAELDGSFNVFAGNGDDRILGSQNGDVISGRGGADTITGNGGDDTFLYTNASDSTPTDQDQVLDFSIGDVISLAGIDADSGTSGNQAFSFVGDIGFSGTAGELRAFNTSGTTWSVEADVDGDATANFALTVIAIDGDPITAGDFIL
ncbi:MAG: cadherin-like domain-containing protein [Pseudomonadota bacterium]